MSNNSIKITSPKDQIIKNGKNRASLSWKPDTGAKKTELFSLAQKFVDSEVLRLSSPYVPFKTGTLMKSGQLGTVIGSGEVNYNAPYAAAQYYTTSESRTYDAQRGGKWFERMKSDHKGEILAGAKRIAGGG